MTLGGDVLEPDLSTLEHFGTKGMKWGVRKVSSARESLVKRTAVSRAKRQKFELATRLNAGEVVVSGLIAGPIGILGYKAIKRHAAVVKRRNRNLSPEAQTDAARKLRLGEALVVGALTTPVGLVTYSAAKYAAASQVDDF